MLLTNPLSAMFTKYFDFFVSAIKFEAPTPEKELVGPQLFYLDAFSLLFHQATAYQCQLDPNAKHSKLKSVPKIKYSFVRLNQALCDRLITQTQITL